MYFADPERAGRAVVGDQFLVTDDCVLLRPEQTELDAEQRRLLAESIAGGGGFTVVSDDLSLYGDEEWKLLERVRAGGLPMSSARPGRPIRHGWGRGSRRGGAPPR